MTVDDLIVLCEEKIASPIANGVVTLMVNGCAHGNTKRLLGVTGEIVCEYEKSCLCAFDAKKILAAIKKRQDRERTVSRNDSI